jgi:hypothetical protein
MNNEPVAWMNSKGYIIPNDVKEAEKVDDFVFKSYSIPLYTHLAKTLTNEEITDIAKEYIHQRLEGERFGYVDFARAILKKAQEK